MNDELINKIRKAYKQGKKYEEICNLFNISKNQLIYLIRKNNWVRKSNKSKVMKGNKNAIGNKGGPGAEENNKRALKTGEYENIFSSCFSEEEKLIYENQLISNLENELENEIKILTIRERRMLIKIQNLQNGSDMLVKSIDKIKNDKKIIIQTKVSNTISEIQKIEESLTRIQKTKSFYISKLDKIRESHKSNNVDDVDENIQKIKEYIWKKKNPN